MVWWLELADHSLLRLVLRTQFVLPSTQEDGKDLFSVCYVYRGGGGRVVVPIG